jgi:hypothetical protein
VTGDDSANKGRRTGLAEDRRAGDLAEADGQPPVGGWATNAALLGVSGSRVRHEPGIENQPKGERLSPTWSRGVDAIACQ